MRICTCAHEEAAMLAEIFFLRLEAVLRASEEVIRAKNSRFVPLSALTFPPPEKGRVVR
jgi:hypothetical protein